MEKGKCRKDMLGMPLNTREWGTVGHGPHGGLTEIQGTQRGVEALPN